jgi:CHAT domain-containing protein
MSSSLQLFREPLTMTDWHKLSIKADLVVFSSCLSGISKAYDSGSTIGFAHTLLSTGTKAFVGSLWPVDDAATLLLMIMFYEELRRPLPAADALYNAQTRMRTMTETELHDLIDELEDVAIDNGIEGYVLNPEHWIEELRQLNVEELAEERYWAAFVLTGYGSSIIYPHI